MEIFRGTTFEEITIAILFTLKNIDITRFGFTAQTLTLFHCVQFQSLEIFATNGLRLARANDGIFVNIELS